MSKDVLLAVIGVLGPLVGFAAAVVSRHKQVSHRVITEELTDEDKKRAVSVVPPDVKITIYADNDGSLVADGKCYVTLLFPGSGAFRARDGVTVTEVAAFMYGEPIGAGSGTDGFRIGVLIRPGTYSVVFVWSATYSGFWGSKTAQCHSRVDLDVRKTGKITVRLGHRESADDSGRPVGRFFVASATPADAVAVPRRGVGWVAAGLLLVAAAGGSIAAYAAYALHV